MPFKYFKKCLKIILLKEFRFLFILIPKNDNNSNKIHFSLEETCEKSVYCLVWKMHSLKKKSPIF